MRLFRGGLIGLLFLCLPLRAAAQIAVHTVALTTDASGDVTAYAANTYGSVLAIRYVPHATTPLDTAATLTISDNVSGLQVLSITSLGLFARDFAPRMFVMTTTGTVALYAAGGTNVLEPVPVAGSVKVVVAAGGNAKSGTIYLFVAGR